MDLKESQWIQMNLNSSYSAPAFFPAPAPAPPDLAGSHLFHPCPRKLPWIWKHLDSIPHRWAVICVSEGETAVCV